MEDLFKAVEEGNNRKVKDLLRSVSPHVINWEGETLLHAACSREGNPLDISIILKAGVDPNIPNKVGNYAIILATDFNQNYVKPLLEYGADPDVINRSGFSPYILGLLAGKSEAIGALREYRIENGGSGGLTPREREYLGPIASFLPGV